MLNFTTFPFQCAACGREVHVAAKTPEDAILILHRAGWKPDGSGGDRCRECIIDNRKARNRVPIG